VSVKRVSVIVSAAAAGLLAACEGRFERAPRADEAASSVEATVAVPEVEGFASAAERTRAMEERAAELEQSLDQAMAEATTEEERLRAYEEFERGRLELNEMAESTSLDDGEDAFPPPP
jgi:hypothetical protein